MQFRVTCYKLFGLRFHNTALFASLEFYALLFVQLFRAHSTKLRLLLDYGHEVITVATANTNSYHKGEFFFPGVVFVMLANCIKPFQGNYLLNRFPDCVFTVKVKEIFYTRFEDRHLAAIVQRGTSVVWPLKTIE